ARRATRIPRTDRAHQHRSPGYRGVSLERGAGLGRIPAILRRLLVSDPKWQTKYQRVMLIWRMPGEARRGRAPMKTSNTCPTPRSKTDDGSGTRVNLKPTLASPPVTSRPKSLLTVISTACDPIEGTSTTMLFGSPAKAIVIVCNSSEELNTVP